MNAKSGSTGGTARGNLFFCASRLFKASRFESLRQLNWDCFSLARAIFARNFTSTFTQLTELTNIVRKWFYLNSDCFSSLCFINNVFLLLLDFVDHICFDVHMFCMFLRLQQNSHANFLFSPSLQMLRENVKKVIFKCSLWMRN